MKFDEILLQIKEKEEKNSKLFFQLLEDCKQYFDKLAPFKATDEFSKRSFAPGEYGRRLSDKIYHLEDVITQLSSKERFNYLDLQKITKALHLIVDHLKKFQGTEIKVEIKLPPYLNVLSEDFQTAKDLENQFISNYINYCRSVLKKKMDMSSSQAQSLELRQTIEIYGAVLRYLSYENVIQIKRLNDEYGAVLSLANMAKEYKSIEESLWQSKQQYDKIMSERENLKEAAKHLTQFQKNEAKAKAYLDEVDKHTRRIENMNEDERHEIEDLIQSYKEAHEIMMNELNKTLESLKTYNVKDVEDHEKKFRENKDLIAKYDTEISNFEKKSTLLETVLTEIQKIRKKLQRQDKES